MDGNVEKNQALYTLKGKVLSVPVVDATLAKKGHAADAKATGDAIAALNSKIDALETKLEG